MNGLDTVTRHRAGTVTVLSPAMFAPEDTTPAMQGKSEPVVPAPTLYWFNEWPDVVATDLLTVRGVTYHVRTDPSDWRGHGVGGLVVRLRVNQLDALGVGRADAESRFTETLEAFTVTSSPADEATGLAPEVETVLYSNIPGGVKYPSLTVSEQERGAQVAAVQDVEIHVPVGATPGVVVDVHWRITASVADPLLVGREYRTKGLPRAGFVTEHAYPVEAIA